MVRLTANIYLPYTRNDNYLSKSQYSNFSTAIILCKGKSDFSKVESEYQQKLKTVTFENMGNFNHVEGKLVQENYISRIRRLPISVGVWLSLL